MIARILDEVFKQLDIGDLVEEVKSVERSRGKTDNVVSEQVRHKPACTSAEKS